MGSCLLHKIALKNTKTPTGPFAILRLQDQDIVKFYLPWCDLWDSKIKCVCVRVNRVHVLKTFKCRLICLAFCVYLWCVYALTKLLYCSNIYELGLFLFPWSRQKKMHLWKYKLKEKACLHSRTLNSFKAARLVGRWTECTSQIPTVRLKGS